MIESLPDNGACAVRSASPSLRSAHAELSGRDSIKCQLAVPTSADGKYRNALLNRRDALLLKYLLRFEPAMGVLRDPRVEASTTKEDKLGAGERGHGGRQRPRTEQQGGEKERRREESGEQGSALIFLGAWR